jgi:hypothetical protein
MHCHIDLRLPGDTDRAALIQQLDLAGVAARPDRHPSEVRLNITTKEVDEHTGLLTEIVTRCEEASRQ